MYYRARYYDPVIGRFPSEDPISFLGGINFYRYVQNDPPTLTDPSGRGPLGMALGGALGAVIGGIAGGTLGGVAGGAGGTLFAPGFGTLGGGIAGAAEGATVGAVAGGGIGGIIGDAIEDFWNRNKPLPLPLVPPAKCDNLERGCENQYQSDLKVCRSLSMPAARSRCFESAENRRWACLNRRPEPPLITW